MRFLVLLCSLFLSLSVISADSLPTELNRKIWQKIYQNKNKEARKLILQNYADYRKNIDILSLYEIILNRLQRKQDAQKIHHLILKIWNKRHKENFIRANYPINLSSYIRMLIFDKSRLYIGYEYFTPYPINAKQEGHYYHKILVFARESKRLIALYKLEKSKYTGQKYELYKVNKDGSAKKVKSFGEEIPKLEKQLTIVKERY